MNEMGKNIDQADFGVLRFSTVRMAERSKAPDSRVDSFLSKGTSGLRMEAWVQIPLLTQILPAGFIPVV